MVSPSKLQQPRLSRDKHPFVHKSKKSLDFGIEGLKTTTGTASASKSDQFPILQFLKHYFLFFIIIFILLCNFSEVPIRKGPKPLEKKKFYLDIKNYALSSKLEAKLKELGGVS